MAGIDGLLQYGAALALVGALTACGTVAQDLGADGMSLSDTPIVSGNTFDRYNDLAVIPPHSENLSISYRYELESPAEGESVPGINGPVWLYAERSAAAPESFFQIGLISGDEAQEQAAESAVDEGPIVETIRLGSIRYKSTLYCVDAMSGAMPAPVAGFIDNLSAHGYGLSDGLFVRHYEGEGPGLDGRWLKMAFVLDITRMGYDCATIGDPDAPGEDYVEAVSGFKDAAARAFEVVR